MSAAEGSAPPLLDARGLVKHYPVRGGFFSRQSAVVRAVDGVSFRVRRGETFSLVGESGCGKSTLGRVLVRLEDPTDGVLRFGGIDTAKFSGRELFRYRSKIQMIFQDPYSSLNPRMTIGEVIREPLEIHRIGRRRQQEERVEQLLREVGLSPDMMERYPHEFSGGQRQRIGIARALALDPELIVADEPLSALDVSVQAQVINLMVHLQREHHFTYVFISHDLMVVEYLSDRIAIMYLGKIVETGTREDIFERPAHPYTRALIASSPVPDPAQRGEVQPIKGEIPSPINPPAGCAFHPRCLFAIDDCRKAVPPLEPAGRESSPEHLAACIRKHEI